MDTGAPTFSIVIPTFNRAEKLRNCLSSIQNQTYKNFEVLVCDDGSVDHTRQVAEDFQRSGLNIRYFYNSNWGGPAFPRNVGISNAAAEWICFLDSDDLWYPQKLERCADYINDYDFICHNFDITDGTRHRGKVRTHDLKGDVFELLMTRGNSIVTSSVCARRSILLAAGGFAEDKRLIAVEDFDLWLRLAGQGYRFKAINECMGSYWIGGENITGTNNKQIERINAVYEKHIGSLNGNKKAMSQAKGMQHYLIGHIKQEMSAKREAVKHYWAAIVSGHSVVKIKGFLNMMHTLL